MQCAEELAGHLVHARWVKLQVVPRRGVGDHIPPEGVCPLLLHDHKGVYAVAKALRHLIPILIQDETIGDHVLVGDTVKEHRRKGMEGKEPPSSLVHSLGNEVGREVAPLIHHLAVLKGVVQLCVGHRPGVKPHIDEICLPDHRSSLAVAEDQVVHIGSVEIDPLVIIVRILAYDKASIGKGVALHQPPLY